jgi:zinc transport system substrate-binding protein
MKKIFLLVLTVIISFGLISCHPTTTASSDKIKVAVSIVPEAAFVNEIAGDLVDVVTIIPPGFSPANYEPSAKQMADLSEASIYFTIGVPTEATTILPNTKEIYTVHLEDFVNDFYLDRMFGEGSRDPHIWLSIKRVIVMVQKIADELSILDPDNEDTFQENATAFIAQLQNADSLLKTAFQNVEVNEFICFHPSYGYFAEDYGLQMISLEEDGKEATPQHLQEVIDLALLHNIHTVFYQAEIDSSQVQAFAEEINGTMVMLDPLAYDYLSNIFDMANSILESLS